MNWLNHYQKLVEKRKLDIPEGYSEKHHIFPTCKGGLNVSENKVRLTAREHLIAHLLLVKIYPGNAKLIHAAFRMSRNRRYSSREYAWLREEFSSAQSKRMSDRIVSKETRKKMSESGKGKIISEEARNKNRESHLGKTLPKLTSKHKAQLSELRKISNAVILICPNCSREGKSAGMRRWHFDHCKEKI